MYFHNNTLNCDGGEKVAKCNEKDILHQVVCC